jgi:hypothetical protein
MAKSKHYNYRPINLAKYKGNPTEIVLRSQYELTFARWCDSNPSVIEWNSERIIVPYRSKIDEAIERRDKLTYKRWHKYYIDFYVKIKERDGIKRYLIEVKPFHETIPPIVEGTNKRAKTIIEQQKRWIINSAKWAAAEEFALDRGMIFKKITEKELYGK